MSGYVKLFESILDSTIWQESKETRLVWITMLAMKNLEQVVEASVPGLAKRAGVSIEECEEAIRRLSSEDVYSRTQANGGRRIEKVDGGWRVLNGEYYRVKLSGEGRREYQAKWQAEYRRRKKAGKGPGSREQLYVKMVEEGKESPSQADAGDNSKKPPLAV